VRPDPVFGPHLGSAANVRKLLHQAKGSGRY